LKICFIATARAVHTQKWVRYFADRGDEVHLISPTSLGEGNIGKAKLHILKGFSLRIKIISFMINLLPRVNQVRNLLKKINPDILHVHYITDNGLLGVMSRFHPLVLSAWGSDILIDPKRNLLIKKLIKYILSRADLVTCDSEMLKRGILDLGVNDSKIRIIYHGVDTEQFSPLTKTDGLKSRLGVAAAPTIICIRSLSPVYNVEMFIRAIPLILKEVPEAKFIIGGAGYQKDYLIGLADSLKVSDAVRFIGWVEHDELPAYLASSDVYVSTSISDSTSLSLQEAMACKLAPVVTDLPANREWITDGENGYIVPINDYVTLASKVVYLLTNREMREKFGNSGRKLIMEKAQYAKEMERMRELCRELIQSGNINKK
jgi:glycosyltransferase involved in cell wall biosynthesis